LEPKKKEKKKKKTKSQKVGTAQGPAWGTNLTRQRADKPNVSIASGVVMVVVYIFRSQMLETRNNFSCRR
jgi:hypothetical protein